MGDLVVFQHLYNVLVKAWNIFDSCCKLLEVNRHYRWVCQPIRQHSLHLLKHTAVSTQYRSKTHTLGMGRARLCRICPHFKSLPHSPQTSVFLHNCAASQRLHYGDFRHKSSRLSDVYTVVSVNRGGENRKCMQNVAHKS